VLYALAAQSLSILFRNNRTFVVLEQNIVLDAIALRLHEIPRPTDRRHEVVSYHDLCFHRASNVEFLLSVMLIGRYTDNTGLQTKSDRRTAVGLRRGARVLVMYVCQ
jgi:hypothetical protein